MHKSWSTPNYNATYELIKLYFTFPVSVCEYNIWNNIFQRIELHGLCNTSFRLFLWVYVVLNTGVC